MEPPELISFDTVTAKVAFPTVWVFEGLNVTVQVVREPVAKAPYIT